MVQFLFDHGLWQLTMLLFVFYTHWRISWIANDNKEAQRKAIVHIILIGLTVLGSVLFLHIVKSYDCDPIATVWTKLMISVGLLICFLVSMFRYSLLPMTTFFFVVSFIGMASGPTTIQKAESLPNTSSQVTSSVSAVTKCDLRVEGLFHVVHDQTGNNVTLMGSMRSVITGDELTVTTDAIVYTVDLKSCKMTSTQKR
jgi:hypothetical protein